MTRRFSDARSKVKPLDYASAGLGRRSRLVTTIGILSICVSCLSLLVGGWCEHVALEEMSLLTQDVAIRKQNAATNAAQVAAAAAQAAAIARAAATRPAPRALTENEIAEVIRYIQSRSHVGRLQSGPLSPAQIKTLTRMLAAPGQSIIDPQIPIGSQDVNGIGYQWAPLAFVYRDGVLYLKIEHGGAWGDTKFSTQIDSAGNELETNVSLPADKYPMGSWLPVDLQLIGEFQELIVKAVLASILLAINLALALLLFVAAVLLLGSKPRGVQLHRLYVLMQIPASIVGWLAFMWMLGQSPVGILLPYAAIPGLLGCAYPLLLLMVLRKGTFLEHQRTELV